MATRNNDQDAVKIAGTTSADVIENSGWKVTITAGKGNDTIQNWNADVSIDAGAGNDSIVNGGDNVTILGGAGNDYIHSWGNAMVYVYSGGNDTIEAFQTSSTLVLGNLTIKDKVYNSGTGDTTLKMSNGGSIVLKEYWDRAINTVASVADAGHLNVIYNDKSKNKISGTSGRDVIISTEDYSKVTINAGAGNDYIKSGGKNNSVDLGNGNDFMENWGNNASIIGGKGNDYIDSWGANSTIDGGAGNDSIGSDADKVSINGGAGNDSLWGGGNNVTFAGGAGNDYIHSWGEGMAYVYSGGNDTIEGFQRSSTLVLGKIKINSTACNYDNGDTTLSLSNGGSIVLSGYWDKSINTVASAADVEQVNVIRNEKNKSKITGTSGHDIIISTGDWDAEKNTFAGYSKVTMNAGAGDDYIKSGGTKNLIDLGDGNDVAENWSNHVTINGGAGNDYIESYREGGQYSSLVGGAGNDSVVNHASYSTIDGGAGNDFIENHDSNVSIDGGKGNDTIINDWTNYNTISGGAGDDYVNLRGKTLVYVYGGGNDTISDFDALDTLVLGSVKINSSVRSNDSTVTLKLSNKKTLTLTDCYANKISTVETVADVEKWNIIDGWENSVALKGTAKKDYIENYGSNVTITAGKGDDLVENYNSNVSIDAGTGNDFVYNNGWYVSINGGAGSDTIEGRGDYSTILGGAGDDSINDRYSPKSLFDGGAGNDTINVFGPKITVTGGTGDDQIFLNSTSNVVKFAAGDGNDTIYGFNSTDSLSISGGSYSTQASGSDVIVTVGKEKILLKNVKGNAITINKKNVGGSSTNKNLIVLTSGVDTLNNGLDGVTISGGKGSDVLENDFGDKVSISAGAGNDTIFNIAREEWNSATNLFDTLDNPDYATLDAGDGNDYIFSQDSKQVSINGGKGNDTIRNFANNSTILGGAGNDTIFNVANVQWNNQTESEEIRNSPDKMTIDGGAGNDYIYNDGKKVLFKYAAGDGNNTIVGFNATSTLKVSGDYYSTKTSGSNVIVTVGKGKIILEGAKNLSKVNISGSKGLSVTDKTTSPVTVASDVKVVDASTRTTAVKMTGNGLANTILGGKGNDSLYGRAGNDSIVGNAGNDKLYGSDGNDTLVGGAGKDTLWGDAGNDKLYGGSGNDTLIYKPGEGTDTIYDWAAGDLLKILKSDGTDGGAFTNSSFKSNNLTLAISGGGKVIFSGVSASDKFNINGTSYSISGTKLKS